MKLLGLHSGKKFGNNETLLKEALMSARESGAEVSMIRLLDLNIMPCNGCNSCAFNLPKGGAGTCVIKDDFAFLDEHIMESDAIIFSAPVFVLGPNGIMKVLADRMGPSHDVFWRMASVDFRKANNMPAEGGPDPRSFKKRVAGFISTGGASTPNWLSLGLPSMYLNTMPSQMKVVDQMEVMAISSYMNVVMKPEHIERARKLGRNVAEAMKNPDKAKWMGDSEGMCPVCHCNLLTVTGKNPVECPICGISGELSVKDGKISVNFSEKEQSRSRLYLEGLKEHREELTANLGMFLRNPEKDQVESRKAKYKTEEYESFVVATQKQLQKECK